MILFIDDLQWGDGDSAVALQEVLEPPQAPAVLFLGSFRSDESAESAFLTDWWKWRAEAGANINHVTIDVAPLSEDQCLNFFAARLGCDIESLPPDVHRWMEGTRGNPYLLEQLIDGFDRETGQFHAATLEQVVDGKLQRLADNATPLLEVIAIAGQAVRLSEVSAVAQQADGVFATITHMRSERLTRLIGSEERQYVDTYHDKIRETVLAKMPIERRRDLHRQYGELLEQNEQIRTDAVLASLRQDTSAADVLETTDRIFDLAYHFHAAGDPRGFAYQLMGGEQSYRAYASEDAVEFLKRAEATLPPDADEAIQYRLWERLASSYARLKMFPQSLHYYDKAIQTGPTPLSRAHAHFGIAKVRQAQGDFVAASRSHDQVLGEMGLRQPTTFGAVLAIPRLLLLAFGVPIRWQRAGDDDAIAKAELVHELYRELALYSFEYLQLPRYVHAFLQQAIAAFRTGKPELVARGLGVLAPHLAQSGFPRLGRRVLKRSARYVPNQRDVEAEGVYRYSSAVTLAQSRDLRQAEQEHQLALPLLIQCGAHQDASMCAHLLRHVQAIIGSAVDELEVAQRVLELAEEVGDLRGQYWGNYDIASALGRAGNVEAALTYIDKAAAVRGDSTMKLTDTIFLATHGGVLLQASDYQAASDTLAKSWQLTSRLNFFMEYNTRGLAWLIESIAGPDWLEAAPTKETKRLRSLCRSAGVSYFFFPNIQSSIQRARGRAFWVLGKQRRAIRCLRRAVERASSLGADYDLARSLLDLAAVTADGRDENRREAIRLLKKSKSVLPRAEAWLLADQFDAQCVAPPAHTTTASVPLST